MLLDGWLGGWSAVIIHDFHVPIGLLFTVLEIRKNG